MSTQSSPCRSQRRRAGSRPELGTLKYVSAASIPLWRAWAASRKHPKNWRKTAMCGALGLFFGCDAALWFLVARTARPGPDFLACGLAIYFDAVAAALALLTSSWWIAITVNANGAIKRDTWSKLAFASFLLFCVAVSTYWWCLYMASGACTIVGVLGMIWQAEHSPMGYVKSVFFQTTHPSMKARYVSSPRLSPFFSFSLHYGTFSMVAGGWGPGG